jgi:phage head maturation protease
MEKVIKTFISEIKGIDEKNFTVEAVVSDETIDRYQEVIKIDAWKKGLGSYKKHGVLLSSHNYGKLTNQIGVAEKVRTEDGKLIAKFKYFTNSGNKEADWGFFLAKQGLAAYSVGFLPKPGGVETADWDDEDVKSGKKPYRTYTDVELLEISQVTVPANPSALQKSINDTEDEFLKEYSQKVYEKMIEVGKDFTAKEEIEVEIVPKNVEDGTIEIKPEIKEIAEEVEGKEMIKETLDAFKKEIMDKLEAIENYIASLEVVEQKEEIVPEVKEVIVPEVLENDVEQKELEAKKQEEENYIRSLLEDMNNMLAKKFSVQSDKDK